jgi:hypothetical protein
MHVLAIPAGKTLTIQPTGAPGQVTILGSAVVDFPADLFRIDATGHLFLNNVTLKQTAPEGFVINNLGRADLNGVLIAGNSGVSFDGQVGSTATITNSTISTNGDTGVVADGDVTLDHDTIDSNTLNGINNLGGGVVELDNSIVFGNGAGDCGIPVAVQHTSLDGDGSCGASVHANPLLGSLANNGTPAPPTQTKAIPFNSPAVDIATFADGITTDQRGQSRIDAQAGPHPDAGAYEFRDTTPPTIDTHADISVTTGDPGGAVVTYTPPSAHDNVDGTFPATCAPASGSNFPVGDTTVTCNATDTHGNAATPTTFVVHVILQVNHPPVITVPADITAEATGPGGATITYSASATDPDPGDTVASFACTPASGSLFPLGMTTVNCHAVDNHGAASDASFHITVVDTTPPTIDAHADITVTTLNAGGATVTYTSPNAHDIVDGTFAASCAPASGSNFPVGDTTVTCNATDAHGNAATPTTFAVHVLLDHPPVITVPNDITAEATGPGGANVTYSASATDPDPGDSVASFACTPASGSLFGFGTTTVNCHAVDTFGAASDASFHITVVDTTAPTIDPHADVTVGTLNPGGMMVTYTAPNAHDAVDGTFAASCAPASGSNFPVGDTTVTCNATDAHGNHATPTTFVVHVLLDHPPVITVPADITAEATGPGGATITYSASATDPDPGDTVASFACTPASGSLFPLGMTTVNCHAVDNHGAASDASFHITVVDTTPPTIDPHADVTAGTTDPSGTNVSYTPPNAHDLVDGTFAATCAPASGSHFAGGDTTVTCNATDAHGNAATATTFVVHVFVDHAPQVDGKPLPDITAEATGPTGAHVAFTVTFSDPDGAGDIASSGCSPASGSLFPLGSTMVTCTVTDKEGLSDSASFHVLVVDTTPPQVSGMPANQTLEATSAAGATATFTLPTMWNDIVDGPRAVSCNHASGETFPLGTTTVACSASDTSGNTANASFTITVQDTTGPVITVPANITVPATGPSGAVVTYTEPTANDAVDGPEPVTCNHHSGDTFPIGTTTVTCTASDSRGNTSTKTFTVTVVGDTTPPVITVPATIATNATSPAGAAVTFTVTANDAVDGPVPVTCDHNSGDTFPLGPGGATHTTVVTCTASDSSGNTATKSFNVIVLGAQDQIKALESKVQGATNLKGGVKKKLTKPLSVALRDLQKSPPNTTDAKAQLNAFIAAVNASAATQAQKTEWTGDANRIKTVIG